MHAELDGAELDGAELDGAAARGPRSCEAAALLRKTWSAVSQHTRLVRNPATEPRTVICSVARSPQPAFRKQLYSPNQFLQPAAYCLGNLSRPITCEAFGFKSGKACRPGDDSGWFSVFALPHIGAPPNLQNHLILTSESDLLSGRWLELAKLPCRRKGVRKGHPSIARNGHRLRDMGLGTSRHEDDQLPCRRSRMICGRPRAACWDRSIGKKDVRFGKTAAAKFRSTSTTLISWSFILGLSVCLGLRRPECAVELESAWICVEVRRDEESGPFVCGRLNSSLASTSYRRRRRRASGLPLAGRIKKSTDLDCTQSCEEKLHFDSPSARTRSTSRAKLWLVRLRTPIRLTWPRPRAVRSMHEAIVWVQPRTSHVTTGSVKPRSSDGAFNQTKGFQICTESDTSPYLALGRYGLDRYGLAHISRSRKFCRERALRLEHSRRCTIESPRRKKAFFAHASCTARTRARRRHWRVMLAF